MREQYGKAYVETDMRAIYNPTRMAVIKRTAEKLVRRSITVARLAETRIRNPGSPGRPGMRALSQTNPRHLELYVCMSALRV